MWPSGSSCRMGRHQATAATHHLDLATIPNLAPTQAVRNPALLREKLELRGERLVSLINGASYGVGVFSTPSLSELRRRAGAVELPPGPLQLSHIATRDVFELHSRPECGGTFSHAALQPYRLQPCSTRQ